MWGWGSWMPKKEKKIISYQNFFDVFGRTLDFRREFLWVFVKYFVQADYFSCREKYLFGGLNTHTDDFSRCCYFLGSGWTNKKHTDIWLTAVLCYVVYKNFLFEKALQIKSAISCINHLFKKLLKQVRM